MKDTLCIGVGHSHHQFGVNLVCFHAIIFTVQTFESNLPNFNNIKRNYKANVSQN